MECKVLGRVGQLVGSLVLVLASHLAWSAPGLQHQLREPHYADETLRLVVTDLEVQALGEAPIRIERSWKDGHWVWNERWSDLEVYGAADPQADASSNEGRPFSVRHLGHTYIRLSSGSYGGGGGSGSIPLKREEDIVLSSLPYRTLIALNRGLDGYLWHDIYGNHNNYSPQGRLTSYVFYNGIKVSLKRDAQHRLVAVKDHLGAERVSFSYDEQGNLVSIRDYSGREVRYEYTGELLTAVTDVRGQRWEYHYSGSVLAGYTDPLQQRTTLALSGDKVRELRQADGKWQKYSYGYEQEEELFYVRRSDESGLVQEQWFDRLGHEVRRQLNGELQFRREYVLSDNSTYVGKISERFRLAAMSSGSSGSAGSLSGIPFDARSGDSDQPEIPYVTQRIEYDARGQRTLTRYNRYQQVTRVLFPDDSEIRRSYDPSSHRLSEEIDETGRKTQYRYDSRGNLTRKIEGVGTPEQYVTEYSYDNLSRLITEMRAGSGDTPEATWQYRYDEHGNRTAVVDPLNQTTTYTHDVLGNVLSLSNALGKTWTASYDAAGNLQSLLTPLNQSLGYQYDSLGQLIQLTAPNNANLTLEYNAGGLPTSVTDAASARTEFEYDAGRRLTAVVDPLGNRLQRQYDARGRLQQQQDAAGNRTQYLYDNDRLHGIDYPTYGMRYSYDNRDRVIGETREYPVYGATQSQSEQYRFLRNGLLQQWQDAAGNATGNEYDGQGRLIASQDAEGGITRYRYDLRGNLIEVSDPAGRLTQFQYDARDAVIAEIKPGDASTPRTERRYQYDALGNLSETVTPDGRVTRYAYDAANRLIEERHYASQAQATSETAERSASYTYNALNNLQRYEDEDSAALYEHDALGRVIRTTVTYKNAGVALFSKVYSYSYDGNGQKTSYTNPEQQTYSYRYTGDGQLAGVSIPGEGSYSQQNFNWLAPQQILYPGGSALQIVQDGLLRQTRRSLNDVAGNAILEHGYQFDAVDNITAIDGEAGTIQYGYDKLYRLTEATYPQGDGRSNEAWAYDGVGNRLDEAASSAALDISQWQYNAHNQLVSHDGIGYRYNADGHLIEKGALQGDGSLTQSGSIDHWKYRYDSRERLVEISKNGQLLAQYAYNPLGQRISKTLMQGASPVTSYYLYSEEGLVGVYDAQGNLQQEFAWDPTAYWMSRPLFTRAQRQDNGQWSVSYYGNSHLGTPEVAFEKSGEVTWRARAQAFGATTVTLNTIDNSLRFPGQYFDAESGLHYNYFRDYDPGVGRYVQSDPIGIYSELNTYGYVGGGVLMYVDPLGLATIDLHHPGRRAQLSFENVKAPDGETYVKGHGDALGVKNDRNGERIPLTAQELARILRDEGWKPGEPVTLVSCNTGDGDYPQQLADELGVPVTAPDGYVSARWLSGRFWSHHLYFPNVPWFSGFKVTYPKRSQK